VRNASILSSRGFIFAANTRKLDPVACGFQGERTVTAGTGP